ncbi:MAG: 50S ribosomal protein L25/general stress protein Ctc [Rhodospirillaceae bacterium]|nr:50S ribosomal protein L25/general stress protein Ctc [Rhodospirillaceae bacterium]
MPQVASLKVKPRERAGKGAARATRRADLVPGVVYGGKAEPTLISVEPRTLTTLLHNPNFRITLFDMEIEGAKSERTMAIEVQMHPVTDRPIHVDFRRIDKNTAVRVPVPVHFLNEGASPGIKTGGVLNVVRHDIEVRVKPDEIPDFIEIDLTGLKIGDSVHINAVKLPKGVKPTVARNFTICSIAPPTVYVEAEPTVDETAAAAATATEGDAAAAPGAVAGAAPGSAPGAAAPAGGAKAAPGAAPGAAGKAAAPAADAKGGKKK